MPVKDILEYVCMYTRKVNEDGQKGKSFRESPLRQASAASQRIVKQKGKARQKLLTADCQCVLNGGSKKKESYFTQLRKKTSDLGNTCETTTKRDERWKTETRSC